MTEVEMLIEQAQSIKARQNKPKSHPVLSHRSWQELLDGKPCPSLRVSRL